MILSVSGGELMGRENALNQHHFFPRFFSFILSSHSLKNFFYQNAFTYFFYLYTNAWINYHFKVSQTYKNLTSLTFQSLSKIPQKQLLYSSVGRGNVLTRKRQEVFQGKEI